jgi:hypothetical protein
VGVRLRSIQRRDRLVARCESDCACFDPAGRPSSCSETAYGASPQARIPRTGVVAILSFDACRHRGRATGIGALRSPLGDPVSPIDGSQQGGRIRAPSFRASASRWVEDLFDHRRILDAGNDPHGSTAGPARPHIEIENWFRTSGLRPAPATPPSPLTARSGRGSEATPLPFSGSGRPEAVAHQFFATDGKQPHTCPSSRSLCGRCRRLPSTPVVFPGGTRQDTGWSPA